MKIKIILLLISSLVCFSTLNVGLFAQSHLLCSGKEVPAGWSRQRLFDEKIVVDVPLYLSQSKYGILPNELCPLKALRFVSLESDNLQVDFILTSQDFPRKENNIKFWKGLSDQIDASIYKYEDSGFININGRMAYFVKLSSSNRGIQNFNVLVFSEHQGKVFYSSVTLPVENYNIIQKTIWQIIMSMKFT